jgi:L-iditol 2-dehydrogenase
MHLPSTMKAVVLTGPDKLEVLDMPTPTPGPADVIIAVESCALCSTDVSLIAHPLPGQPPYGEFIIGHEYSGRVVALGSSVDEFAIGDRVAVEAHLGCQRCRNCRLGNYTACLNYGNAKKGHRANGFTTNGGNAQYVANHINTVYKIPDKVSFDEASLVTNLGCVLYGFETLGGYIVGETVAIIGPGPLGLVSAITASALGAGKVILTGTRASRLKVAEQLPIDRIVNSSEEDPYEVIMRETGGVGADIVIESSGSELGMELAIRASKRMGKILLLGFPHHPAKTDLATLALNNKHIFTVRGEGWANVGRAVSMLGRGSVDLKPLITHTFPLNRITEAFSTFVDRTDGAIKVISKPQEWDNGKKA